MIEMIDVFAKTFMTATFMDGTHHNLTRVKDAKKWDAPNWWRDKATRRPARYIDLDKL